MRRARWLARRAAWLTYQRDMCQRESRCCGEVGAAVTRAPAMVARVDEDGLLDGLFERVGDRVLKAECRALGGRVVPCLGTSAHAGRLEEGPAQPRADQ